VTGSFSWQPLNAHRVLKSGRAIAATVAAGWKVCPGPKGRRMTWGLMSGRLPDRSIPWHAARGRLPGFGEAAPIKRVVAAIIERVEQLAMSPDGGRVVPEFETPWLRELEPPPFRIVYRRDEAAVTVIRVWRSERLMDPNLARNA